MTTTTMTKMTMTQYAHCDKYLVHANAHRQHSVNFTFNHHGYD